MLIKDVPEGSLKRGRSEDDEEEDKETGTKRAYDLSISGLSGIVSGAMRAGVTAFSNDSSARVPRSQPSTSLLQGEPGDDLERLRINLLRDHLQVYSQNEPARYDSSLLKLGLRCSSAPPELSSPERLFVRPNQDFATRVIREMKKYIMFLKQELKHKPASSPPPSLSKSEELLPTTPPPNKPVPLYRKNREQPSPFSDAEEEECKNNESACSSILRACASTSRLLTAAEVMVGQTQSESKSRNKSVSGKSKTSPGQLSIGSQMELLKCRVAEVKKERNTYFKILQNTRQELERTRRARESDGERDRQERLLLSEKLRELTNELKLSMHA